MKKSESQRESIEPCDFYKNGKLKDAKIRVVGWKRSCRYHRKIGQELPFKKIVPDGFCIFAYHTLYPHALSLLYDGGNPDKKLEVFCPASKNSIVMSVTAHPRRLGFLYNLAEKILRIACMPQDIIDKRVKIEVIDVKGKCPIGIEKGSCFEFNIGDKLELCPASFNTILPFLLAKLSNPTNDASIECPAIQCPADACRIQYEIER